MNFCNDCFKVKGETLYLLESSSAEDIIQEAAENGQITCFRRIGEQGIFSTLAACSKPNSLGFDIESVSEYGLECFLHGRTAYTGILSVNDEQENAFLARIQDAGCRVVLLGHVTRGEFRVDGKSYGFVQEYA